MKNKFPIILISVFTVNMIYAGCGACNVDNKKAESPIGDFVTSVSENGTVDGMVLASCGMCNFGMRNKDCSLAIQISYKAYNVKGSDIDDHGDSHAKDGFCNVVRIVKVKGKVKNKKLYANSSLILYI